MGQILGMIRVKQSSVAIKETFGKFDGVLQSGCHCVPWWCGSNIAGRLSTRLQILRVCSKTKTKDDVFVSVSAAIEYKVMPEKAFMAFYNGNTRQHIQDHAVNAIWARVANLTMNEAYEKQRDFAAAIKEDLKKATLDYGIEIGHILITDVEPAEPTKRAMIEINAATHMRVAKNKMSKAEKILEMKKAREEVEYEYIDELQVAWDKEFRDNIRTSGMTKEIDNTSSFVSSHRGSGDV